MRLDTFACANTIGEMLLYLPSSGSPSWLSFKVSFLDWRPGAIVAKSLMGGNSRALTINHTFSAPFDGFCHRGNLVPRVCRFVPRIPHVGEHTHMSGIDPCWNGGW